jgi:hypothetical protein
MDRTIVSVTEHALPVIQNTGRCQDNLDAFLHHICVVQLALAVLKFVVNGKNSCKPNSQGIPFSFVNSLNRRQFAIRNFQSCYVPLWGLNGTYMIFHLYEQILALSLAQRTHVALDQNALNKKFVLRRKQCWNNHVCAKLLFADGQHVLRVRAHSVHDNPGPSLNSLGNSETSTYSLEGSGLQVSSWTLFRASNSATTSYSCFEPRLSKTFDGNLSVLLSVLSFGTCPWPCILEFGHPLFSCILLCLLNTF